MGGRRKFCPSTTQEGNLTQYMRPTDEYPSMRTLRAKIHRDMELQDVDIYRIEQTELV